MRRLGRIFNRIMVFLGARRNPLPQDIPKKLSPEVLNHVMREAQFLRGVYGVEVRAIEPGEVPGTPKPADGSVIL